MSENRDEVLANFQACTGIDDVGEAIYVLEETNWDLVQAVNKVMPQDSQSFQVNAGPDVEMVPEVIEIPSSPVETATDMLSVGNNVGTHSQSMPLLESNFSHNNQPSTSSVNVNGARLIRFNVQYCDRVVAVDVPDTGTVADIKKLLNKKLKVPPCRQLLSGWARMGQYQNTPLSELSLPSVNALNLSVMSNMSAPQDDYPEHELTLRQGNANVTTNNRERKPRVDGVIQMDSDDEEYEDASESFNVEDDCFLDNEPSKRIEPLIPKHIEDDIVGSISFVEQFTNRYGPIHPTFYQGTLDDAIREACNKPAKDRKLLAVYLHHDASVLTNVFCTELLGFESVMQLLEANFVLWGWDLTFETNRTRIQNALLNSLGPAAGNSLKNIPVNRLPALFIISKFRSTIEIYNIVYGNVGVSELLSSLIEAVEIFSEHQKVEVKEEQNRAEREMVKYEQDMAYKESLEADRAKEEAKRALAEFETKERQKKENEIAEEKARKEAYRLEVEAGLTEEPPASAENITKIRFRLPSGDNLERRFFVSSPLKVLLDYCIVKGYPSQEYKIISSWPRRDLTSLDVNKTLLELNLHPQETVILEER